MQLCINVLGNLSCVSSDTVLTDMRCSCWPFEVLSPRDGGC